MMVKCRASLATRRPVPRMRLAGLVSVAFMFGITLLSCRQPQDESAGFWLRGEAVESRVADWRFTKDIQEVFIQTTPWYLIPHSTTIWCVELNGGLYIGSYGNTKKQWEHNVLRNPNAKMRVAARIYKVTIGEVEDDATNEALDAAYATKYDMVSTLGPKKPQPLTANTNNEAIAIALVVFSLVTMVILNFSLVSLVVAERSEHQAILLAKGRTRYLTPRRERYSHEHYRRQRLEGPE